MDRRTVLALVLVAAVILLTPRLFPPAPAPILPDSSVAADSLSRPAVDTAQRAISAAPAQATQRDTSIVRIPAETLHVADSNAAIAVLNTGGALQAVELRQ